MTLLAHQALVTAVSVGVTGLGCLGVVLGQVQGWVGEVSCPLLQNLWVLVWVWLARVSLDQCHPGCLVPVWGCPLWPPAARAAAQQRWQLLQGCVCRSIVVLAWWSCCSRRCATCCLISSMHSCVVLCQ